MDTSGNAQLESAKDFIIILVFIVGGICTYIKVRTDYFKTEEGKQALKSAKEVIYNQVKYTTKQFAKLLGWTSIKKTTVVKKIEKAVSNTISWVKKHVKLSNTVVRSNTTILVAYRPGEIPKEYVVATLAIPKMKRNKYYSAYLDKNSNNVYIGPVIPYELARDIVLADRKDFGVFILSRIDAIKFMTSIGPHKEHPPHGGSGYYKHFHLLLRNSQEDTRHAHVWFYM